MSTKKTHEADGLFYLTEAALLAHQPCNSGMCAFRYAATEVTGARPEESTPVIVTLELLAAVFRRSYCGSFLLGILSQRGGGRSDAFRRAQVRYWDLIGRDVEGAARVVMDAILAYHQIKQQERT